MAAAAPFAATGFASLPGSDSSQHQALRLQLPQDAKQQPWNRVLLISTPGSTRPRAANSVALRRKMHPQVAVDGASNATTLISKVDLESDVGVEEEPSNGLAIETTFSAVIADVENLVKLVDSKDIVELELKHFDYELVIRKKEALPPPPAPSLPPPQYAVQASYLTHAPSPSPSAPVAAPAAAPTPAPALAHPPAPAAPASATPAADSPCILSPMAGTFYKSPAPGEPPFLKVGDKVQKGQVICIVEAMKLMNEIEADQSGTIVEFLVEDGKPVAIDTPLFAIKP